MNMFSKLKIKRSQAVNIVTNLKEWQKLRLAISSQSIGFVPTMGNLHAGHAALIERAKKENDVVIVSIFVNPTQFNDQKDFINYPVTLEEDKKLLCELGVDYLLLPRPEEMYHDQYEVQVSEISLSQELEGVFRPGHFSGMMTIVLKLLNLTQATRTYFGEKDYQQFLLVKKMAHALFLPVEVISCPTVRTTEGLALSSRNSRLNHEEYQLALLFPQVLNSDLSLEEMKNKLEEIGFKVEYIVEQWGRRLAAVQLGAVRLIDNIAVN